VTVSAHKKLAVRLLGLGSIVALLGLWAAVDWQATRPQVATCAFHVPSQTLSTGRSFNSYVDRGDCIRLGRVSSPQDLEQGLSSRDFMPFDEGMLFIFANSGKQCMWMKGMRFHLDMIWLDADKTINHIETNLSPASYPQLYCGNGDALYVIEVNGGVATAAKLKIGDKLSF
jgi:uncharacterized membrane protein (UPF0127 family)